MKHGLSQHRIHAARYGAFTICAVLGIWQLVSILHAFPPIFLPSPAGTAVALWDLLISGRFFSALFISVLRITVATILAVTVGFSLGILMGASRRAEALLQPIIQPLRYLPITALIPLFILWFGIGETMKITFLFMGIVCYFIPLVRNAVRSVPQEYIDVANVYGAGFPFILRRIFIPFALPQMWDGLIVINGIGWTYIILAEIVNAQNGLGYLLYIAGRLQRSDEAFAGLFLICFVAITSDFLLRHLRKHFCPWQPL